MLEIMECLEVSSAFSLLPESNLGNLSSTRNQFTTKLLGFSIGDPTGALLPNAAKPVWAASNALLSVTRHISHFRLSQAVCT